MCGYRPTGKPLAIMPRQKPNRRSRGGAAHGRPHHGTTNKPCNHPYRPPRPRPINDGLRIDHRRGADFTQNSDIGGEPIRQTPTDVGLVVARGSIGLTYRRIIVSVAVESWMGYCKYHFATELAPPATSSFLTSILVKSLPARLVDESGMLRIQLEAVSDILTHVSRTLYATLDACQRLRPKIDAVRDNGPLSLNHRPPPNRVSRRMTDDSLSSHLPAYCRSLDLAMAQEQLDRPQDAGSSVDRGRRGPRD